MNSLKENNMNVVDNFSKIQQEGLNLFIKKNHDYGESYKDYGLIGVLVRLGDKIKRLQNITNKGINLVNDESLRDTLIDLQNYSTMAIMLYDDNNDKNNNDNNDKNNNDNNDKNNDIGLIISEAGVGNIYR